jgi:hypothetical protein
MERVAPAPRFQPGGNLTEIPHPIVTPVTTPKNPDTEP